MSSRDDVEAIRQMGISDYKATAPYRVTVPLGKSGPWTIKRFTTTFDLPYLRHFRDGRAPGLGAFTRLVHDQHGVIMSDTCAEIGDLKPYICRLKGRVLVTGLGLGMVIHILTKAPELKGQVKTLTVIEKDKDILKLVKKHYASSDSRVNIIHADAFEWTPPKGTKFDSAWHDIWWSIDEDNLDEMDRLIEHYRPYCFKRQQFCWGRDTIKRMQREARVQFSAAAFG